MGLEPQIRALYDYPGPFATAYLDATRSDAEGGHEVDLRWRAARESLARQGASEATLVAMDSVAGADHAIPGPHGQIVVAAAGEVRFSASLPHPPRRPGARHAPLPHLMPYLAEAGPQVRHVLVVADHEGADIYTGTSDIDWAEVPAPDEEVTGPKGAPLHKTRRNVWSERHFQNRVENAWAANTSAVVEHVRRHIAQSNAKVVLVAGEVQGRTEVRDALVDRLPPQVRLEELVGADRADAQLQPKIHDEIHEALLRYAWRNRHVVLSRVREGLGRGDFAVSGLDAVLEALRQGQVETLVIADDPSSPLTAWIGPQPLELSQHRQDLIDLGIAPQKDRLDAALVRAVSGTDADLVVTPGPHDYLADGLAAVLRFAL